MVKIGIVGSRSRDELTDLRALKEVLRSYFESNNIIPCRNTLMIVSGGCPKGGDRFAEILAKSWGVSILIHYPAWSREGKSAGFLRNSNIVQDSDVLFAVVSKLRSGGTEDTIRKMYELCKPVYEVF